MNLITLSEVGTEKSDATLYPAPNESHVHKLFSEPGKPYGHCFWTEPVFGSFLPYGHFLLAGGRIWPYATHICLRNC